MPCFMGNLWWDLVCGPLFGGAQRANFRHVLIHVTPLSELLFQTTTRRAYPRQKEGQRERKEIWASISFTAHIFYWLDHSFGAVRTSSVRQGCESSCSITSPEGKSGIQSPMAAKYGFDQGRGVEWLESQPESQHQEYVNQTIIASQVHFKSEVRLV